MKECDVLMNILLTSVGRRSYLVKYFKEAIGVDGEVHVSNSNKINPSFMYADKSVVTPLIYNKDYIPFLLDYCSKNNIVAIISLFDIDLFILTKSKRAFEKIGVRLIISDESVIRICNDKWLTYEFLKNNGFNVPKTFLSVKEVKNAILLNQLDFPLIIKPRWGMGSISIYNVTNLNELDILYKKVKKDILNTYLKYESQNLEKSVIIQEKLNGQEYGLDIINDLHGIYKTTIVKKKYAMRSGETDCAKTIFSADLKKLGEEISNKLKHIGNLDVDVFIENRPYVLEMNARFGGGYPFSHIAGINLPLAIILWLKGEKVDESIFSEKIGVLAHKTIEIIEIKGINNE